MRSLILATCAALAAVPAAAQRAAQPADTAAYVVTLGSDTVSVERFVRAGNRIEGQMVSRSPRTVARSFTAWLNPDGSVQRLTMTSTVPGTQQPATVANVRFTPDSAITRVQRGDSVFAFRVKAPHPVPLVNYDYAFYEQAMMHARAVHRDSLTLTQVPVGSNQTYALGVQAMGADSMRLTNLAGPQHVATDARGRLLWLDGFESTQKFIVHRLRTVDVDAFAADFARRDAAHQGMGTLSPRDSAVADWDGAHLAVDYGRPSMRGRVIFGGVVPWGQVWRTGANAATGFTTTKDLDVGGATVPAGSYTLWTIPTATGWTLIVNRETGQWGTDYDAAHDLAHIPMQTRRLDAPVEEFTIRLEPQGSGGVLRLQWADTEASVPITVK